MNILSSFLAIQRLRASLGKAPQGQEQQIAALLDKTLQLFEQDIENKMPIGGNIIPLQAWKKSTPTKNYSNPAQILTYPTTKVA